MGVSLPSALLPSAAGARGRGVLPPAGDPREAPLCAASGAACLSGEPASATRWTPLSAFPLLCAGPDAGKLTGDKLVRKLSRSFPTSFSSCACTRSRVNSRRFLLHQLLLQRLNLIGSAFDWKHGCQIRPGKTPWGSASRLKGGLGRRRQEWRDQLLVPHPAQEKSHHIALVHSLR